MMVASPLINAAGDQCPVWRAMTVVRIAELSPRIRRVTLSGDDLAPFDTPGQLHVRLSLGEDGSRATRLYTIRRIDAEGGEMDIDFFLHDRPGPAGDWAARARPGAACEITGPVGRPVLAADWYIFAGDETALPAIARVLEGLPASAAGVAVLSVGTPDERIGFSHPPGVLIRWVHPSGGETVGHRLFATVAALVPPAGASVFAWAGADANCIRRLKAHWQAPGINPLECLAVAYWR